jgi:hypothetical protein
MKMLLLVSQTRKTFNLQGSKYAYCLASGSLSRQLLLLYTRPMAKKNNNQDPEQFTPAQRKLFAIGISVGVAIGAISGVLLGFVFNNAAIGVNIGVGSGLAIGAAIGVVLAHKG